MRKLICFFFDHRFGKWSEPYRIGFTTAPYPAVDECEQSRSCARCKYVERRFAGFVMSNDARSSLMAIDGYYLNSLEAWRSDLLKKHRSLMARYGRLERAGGQPTLRAQGRLIDLNKRLIEIVTEARDAALTE